MKTKKLLIPLLTGVLCAAAAHAQVDITITGSTAARRIVYDRVASLFTNITAQYGGTLSFANSANKVTITGLTSALGATPVTIRFAMSGAVQGLIDLNAGTLLNTFDATGANVTNTAATFSFADQFPGANPVPLSTSLFTANTNLFAQPFVFIKNFGLGMAGVTNITKEQAIMLFSTSGQVGGFDAIKPDFLGGTTDGGAVYLIGRDAGSGTRVGAHKCVGFTGTPVNWATNASGVLVPASTIPGVAGVALAAGGYGYSSGGTLCKIIATPSGSISTSNLIGYAGEPDASSGNGTTVANYLAYEGVFPTHENVAKGRYALWFYEHIYAKSGTLVGNTATAYNAIVAALTDPAYQASNPVFTNNAVALAEMWVSRGVDGGSFTGTGVSF